MLSATPFRAHEPTKTAVLASAAVILALSARADPQGMQVGVIALTDSPFCDFFIVQIQTEFSLLVWRGGRSVFVEGDWVWGALSTVGPQTIGIDFLGAEEMRVDVQATGLSLRDAQRAYFSRCHPLK